LESNDSVKLKYAFDCQKIVLIAKELAGLMALEKLQKSS